jgi:hypothetical protein
MAASDRPNIIPSEITLMTTPPIAWPRVVSRAEWLESRKRLLAQEKELTHARDRLNSERRGLPMVRVDEPYVFESEDGPSPGTPPSAPASTSTTA